MISGMASASSGAAASILSLAIDPNSTEPVVMSMTSSMGTVTAAAISMQTVLAAGGAVTIGGNDGTGVTVTVPAAVLSQASQDGRPVALTVVSMSLEAASKLMPATSSGGTDVDAPRLSGSPVSIVLYDSDGLELKNTKLPQPMTLTVEGNATAKSRCAFFDESRGVWSNRGVRNIETAEEVMPGTVACETEHLTIFASVVGEFTDLAGDAAQVIRCSNAGMLFSLGGLAKLVGGTWWRDPSAVSLWTFLATVGAVFAVARYLDIRDARKLTLADKLLLRRASTRSRRSIERRTLTATRFMAGANRNIASSICPSFCTSLLAAVVALLKNFGAFASLVFPICIMTPRGIVKLCAESLHIYRAGVDSESMTIAQEVFDLGTDDAVRVQESLQAASSQMEGQVSFQVQAEKALDDILLASWPRRFLRCFPALHPWAYLTLFSLVLTRCVRLALLLFNFLVSFACSAVFTSLQAKAQPEG